MYVHVCIGDYNFLFLNARLVAMWQANLFQSITAAKSINNTALQIWIFFCANKCAEHESGYKAVEVYKNESELLDRYIGSTILNFFKSEWRMNFS